jgi:hypothetical protein
MTKISETEFARICDDIFADRAVIYRHNPLGTEREVLLWMLLCCLNSYLNLSDIETPCFNGKPDEKTYREAILFVLQDRRTDDFDAAFYLDKLTDL